MKKLAFVVAMIFISTLFLGAYSPVSEFIEGNSHYEKDEYDEALVKYLGVAKSISNWKLYYNIGNTYFKLGDFVKSKINFLKAKKLNPFDSSIKQNLQIVEEMLNNSIKLTEPGFLSITIKKIESLFTINFLSILLLSILLIFCFFIFRLARIGRSKINVYGILLSFILLIFISIYHIHRVNSFYNENYAVIVNTNARLRSGPGINNTVLFEISPGVTIRIIDVKRDWIQVSASSETAGWINVSDVERISIK